MRTLTIDPPIPFLIPPFPIMTVALVGCGGTGSHLAQSLARLAVHCQQTTQSDVRLCFIDGDMVEAKNVGRQLFCPSDIGRNKAQVLAARLSGVFGLRITAIPHMLTETRKLIGSEGYGILVGAVDSAAARRVIAHELGRLGSGWNLWIDSGNHESSGQVCVGTSLNPKDLRGALAIPGVCSRLPAPSVLYPDLLVDAPIVVREDCATAVLDNVQALCVNQMMAAIASSYLSDLLIKKRITTFCTSVDLPSLTMRSTPITASTLAEAGHIRESTLRKVNKS